MEEEHVCEGCDKKLPDVTWVANPYDEDVNNTINMQWLCNTCYDNYCDDI